MPAEGAPSLRPRGLPQREGPGPASHPQATGGAPGSDYHLPGQSKCICVA